MRCRTRGEAPFKRSIKAALLRGGHKPTPPQLLNGVLNLIFGSALTSELRSLLKPARRDKAFTLRDVGDYSISLRAWTRRERQNSTYAGPAIRSRWYHYRPWWSERPEHWHALEPTIPCR